jgi:uncharacterized protein (TIGR02246 family)
VAVGYPLTEIHPAVEAGVNKNDLEGLMSLYADDARLVGPEGEVYSGKGAIREQWAALLGMGGVMTVRTRFAVDLGDLAMLSNSWTFRAGAVEMSGTTAEIARRQSDGTWLYIVDHPFALTTS